MTNNNYKDKIIYYDYLANPRFDEDGRLIVLVKLELRYRWKLEILSDNLKKLLAYLMLENI